MSLINQWSEGVILFLAQLKHRWVTINDSLSLWMNTFAALYFAHVYDVLFFCQWGECQIRPEAAPSSAHPSIKGAPVSQLLVSSALSPQDTITIQMSNNLGGQYHAGAQSSHFTQNCSFEGNCVNRTVLGRWLLPPMGRLINAWVVLITFAH